MTTQHSLWLIDDDPALRLILEDTFCDAGLTVHPFSNAKGAWVKLNEVLKGQQPSDSLPDVILTDIRMPMMDGLSFSQWMQNNFPQLPVIIMTAHSDLKSAVDSYETGAFEYLPKPFDLDQAVLVIKKAIQSNPAARKEATAQTQAEKIVTPTTTQTGSQPTDSHLSTTSVASCTDSIPNTNKQSKNAKQNTTQTTPTDTTKITTDKAQSIAIPADTNQINKTNKPSKTNSNRSKTNNSKIQPDSTTPIIGQSVAMQTVFRAIGRLASSPITVLITGESGTGKELVAGALHQNSPRSKKPFIALNMAAIPQELIESELFGHEKGAFTGATTQRQGRFEQANGGTLFLDEIGDMPFSTQTRLLRVLANGEFFRVGGQQPIKVDVRIIAATHQNLEQLVKEGKFREDLFYRLNVIRLPLPPLRDRPDDIAELVDFFMAKAAKEMNTDKKQLSTEAMHIMQAFDWPGNVRQLENACRWITVMATGDLLTIEDLPPDLTEFAKRYLTQQIQQEHIATQSESNNNTARDIDVTNNSAINNNGGINNSDVTTIIDNLNNQILATPAQTDATKSLAKNLAFIDTPSSVKAQHLPDINTQSSQQNWQQQLRTWATNALNAGQTDILQQAAPEFETVLIEVALNHSKGRKGDASELLGWGRNTLTRKIKLLGLNDNIDNR
ncbi:sigma-54-dependent Fis family transcriptional regulator [Psychrobacter lutiphocae]|uniref:sigma-54-dependent Fis family transcriptional regulator n=1 Tax=Psychrobacter lutiphocae TaxID=540500 RepID=UPI00037AE220|nr:sigma-54-dependent Fis family transcriptional regulator [Psychrobacter lutiphocae]